MIRFEEKEGLEPVSTDTMTPMIDVILSLIAFMMLMINAPLLTLDIDLPDVQEQASNRATDVKSVNLVILANAQNWQLGNKLITGVDALKIELEKTVVNADTPVSTVLSIDQNSAAQRMIETLDILNKLGIKDTQIALESTEPQS